MDQYLKQIKAFTDREIIFSIHILKGVFSNVEYKLSADYLVSLIEANGLNGHQIKYLINTTNLLLIDNKFIFENKDVSFQIFLYHELKKFGYIYPFINFNFINDFYQKLLYAFDVCCCINSYQDDYLQYQNSNIQTQHPNPQAYQFIPGHYNQPIQPSMNNPNSQAYQFPPGYYNHSIQPTSDNQNSTSSQPHHDHDQIKVICDNLKNCTYNVSKNIFFEKVEMKYNTSFRLQIKQLHWVDSSNLDQLYWIIEYLQKNGLGVLPDIAVPHDAKYLYNLVVGSVQHHFANNSYNYQAQPFHYVLDKMHKAWYQKTYRDKKDSLSALKYLISRQHLKSLYLLADERKATPIEVLEELIDNELRKNGKQ